jgi:hypothetical protein
MLIMCQMCKYFTNWLSDEYLVEQVRIIAQRNSRLLFKKTVSRLRYRMALNRVFSCPFAISGRMGSFT